jgi:hypothetical protein
MTGAQTGSGWIFAYNLQRMTVVDRMSHRKRAQRWFETIFETHP